MGHRRWRWLQGPPLGQYGYTNEMEVQLQLQPDGPMRTVRLLVRSVS